MSHTLRFALLGCSALALATPALAQESAQTTFTLGDTDTVVVTANRILTSIDVIASDIAQDANVDYGWELVSKLPGILITEFNQGATSGKLSFRGFNGEGEVNAVKFLIDGIPSNSNDGNMPYIDMIFPLEINSVEVVRGTTDPRYGLHSIGGNVTFLTRTGGNYLDSRVSVGSFAEYDVQLAAGFESGALSQNYSASYRQGDGYRDHSESDRWGVSGKWNYEIAEGTTLGASARHYEANAQEPGYLTSTVAYSTPTATNAYNATDLDTREMNQFSINLDSSLSDALSFKSLAWLNQLRDDRFVKFSATASQQNRYTEEDHWGALAALTYAPEVSFAKSLSVELGASVEEQDNISKRFNTVLRVPTTQTRDQAFTLSVKGLYAQADIELTDWLKIVPAWRVDWVDGDFVNRLSNAPAGINEYGAIQQPKLSIAATPMENVTLYANWGRTFQIGVGSGAYLIPPRLVDLEPSTNEGWEAGIRYAPDANTELRAAIWKQTATGEIKRRLNDPLGDFDNLGATERDGVDVQASTSPIDGLSLWGAIAWQRAKITTPDPATPTLAGKAIDHVPSWLYNAGIDYRVTPELTLSASARAQTSYELTTSNDRGRFGDFVLLNASASYALTPWAEAGLEIQNIGDEYYEYVWWDGAQTLHSPGEGRAVIASLRLRS